MAINPQTWMTQNFNVIQNLPLTSLCMPGSHDAGMSVINYPQACDACDTQTQSLDVLGQLNAGSRYFDLRPALWLGMSGFCTAHWSPAIDGIVGAAGQSLADILSQVSYFLAQDGCEKEIVILKFSHYIDFSTGVQSSWTKNQMQGLVTAVLGGVTAFTSTDQDINLNALTPSDIVNGTGRVLLVFDQFSLITDPLPYPAAATFSYSDFISSDSGGLTGNLTVFDCYSNTDALTYMQADQLGKFSDDTAHNAGALILVSWTLTMDLENDADPSAKVCIIPPNPQKEDKKALSTQANETMTSQLMAWVNAGYITSNKIPNIIFRDNVTSDGTVDFCMWLNNSVNSSASNS